MLGTRHVTKSHEKLNLDGRILSRDRVRLEMRFGSVTSFIGHLHSQLQITTKQSHRLTLSKHHCNYSTHKVFTVFISRCLVAASNCGHSPSSRFPNCSRPQLPATTELLVLGTDRTENVSSIIAVFFRCRGNNVSTELFPGNGCCTVACLHSCYLAMGLHVTILLK
jgi:hypothetical protein